MTSSDVEDERLDLHCLVIREGGAAGTTEVAHRGQAAPSSSSGEVNGERLTLVPHYCRTW